MIFTSDEFEESLHFVAMEYCWLIFNRTYLIVCEEDRLIGIKMNGPIGNQAPGAAGMLAVKGDLSDPFSYIEINYARRIEGISLLSEEALSIDSANFSFDRDQIKSISHNPKKKWGMGVYPHDGRIIVDTNSGAREFIVLGSQSGETLAKKMLSRLNVGANEI